ncbi:Diguanylate cyclase DosC [Planctomycetes bacterium CA13]|uniref:diguanylate cyclase n=1 Tax=Novipirellula herctigrandis TaxID=2527986 RepID=A0A5C5Z192_9BACT|nr:Diguanylate cyclase DosC [Planctomycetes bacterium CA13]
MLKLYLASLRIAIVVICVGISIVLCTKILGFVPDRLHGDSRSIIQFVVFLVVAGVGAYTLLVARLMGSFKVSQVVADRVRKSLDAFSEGLLLLDERQRIVVANRALSETIGVKQGRLVGCKVQSLNWAKSPASATNGYPWVRAAVELQRQSEALIRYKHPEGGYRLLAVNASPIAASESTPGGVLVTFRDVTVAEEHHAELEQMVVMLKNNREEMRNRNRQLQVLATLDALTECRNRRALFEFFELAWTERHQKAGEIACLMFDNDHFKSVNDTYGHQVGDMVLQRVANVLKDSFTDSAIVCRYGGEEFCVVMTNANAGKAFEAAELARQRIEELRFEKPADLTVSVSIGVSMSGYGAEDPQEMIHQADRCLYVAKEQGRNRVIMFSDAVDKTTQSPDCVCSTETRRTERIKKKETVRGIVALLDVMEENAYSSKM